ncbi:serine/threonine protein kinase, partial [candidate division KSB1 bacterium]|nr:serine/threonine protein kinase [candidate division KSB1 bacterium]
MVGKTVSNYKILEKLGEGGMGRVYRAKDTRLGRMVALKFLPLELTRDSKVKQRFIREAQAASALQHENICTIHDIDETPDGQLFIVMDFYTGRTLNEIVSKGPLPLDRAIDIAIQIAAGLNEAHKKGIIHRDLKSANIMVTETGRAKMLDFGLAILSGKTRLTKTGSTLGTIAYMSPEQTKGEQVDHRTDIWSFGVILYEMLTGLLPFRGDYDQAVIYSIVNLEPEPMTGLRTGIPVALEAIVNKLLAKKSADRYQHIDELPVDLKHVEVSEKGAFEATIPANQLQGGVTSMIGRVVAHYKILSKLGEGGMGVVYKAKDTRLDRMVALKFLAPEFTRDAKAKQRFIHEAKTASALDHPNICTIYEINETDDGQLYIAMAYYEGQTLKDRIAPGRIQSNAPLPIEEITDMALQVSRGLAKAHEKGIVHRDINPSNIMITTDGMVKIMDFGLAKLLGDKKLTQTGITLGTVSYMSPEQLRGEKVKPASDIWSFGVVLYEMITGQLPFSGEHTPALIYAINNENAPVPNRLRPDAPPFLCEIIERCLKKDANSRPDSMDKIYIDLRRKNKPGALSFLHLPLRRRVMAAAIFSIFFLFTILLIWNMVHPFMPFSDNPRGKWDVSILPFRDYSDKPETAQWPELIQSMIVNELTGAEAFSVVEPMGLNNYISSSLGGLTTSRDSQLLQLIRDTDASVIIDGDIRWERDAFSIQSYIHDRKSGERPITNRFYFSRPDELSQQTKNLVNEIYNYLQVKVVPP